MLSIRFARPILASAAMSVAFAVPLTLAGCGGSSGETELAKPKEAPTVAAKDSMKEYLKNHQNQGKKK